MSTKGKGAELCFDPGHQSALLDEIPVWLSCCCERVKCPVISMCGRARGKCAPPLTRLASRWRLLRVSAACREVVMFHRCSSSSSTRGRRSRRRPSHCSPSSAFVSFEASVIHTAAVPERSTMNMVNDYIMYRLIFDEANRNRKQHRPLIHHQSVALYNSSGTKRKSLLLS